jgi:hypothetical protein
MSGTHFYLTLPSNASLDVFPDNKTTEYRVKLPQPTDLDGNWEVGLYSISYPNTWYALRNINADTHFYCDDGSGFYSTVELDHGFYESVQEFITDINKVLKKKIGDDSIYFTYSTRTGKVTCHLKKPRHKVFVARRISLVLGYAGKETIIDVAKGAAQESPYVADLSFFSSIFTYCDIIQPQIVGDTSAQLFRSIPVEGKYGDIITKTFTNIQYVPVQTKSFGDVKILLRNDTGDPVPFERGKVITTLHFRQHTYFA